MKAKVFYGNLLAVLLVVMGLPSCLADNDMESEGGRKITGYQEYILTVASVKLPGVLTSCGGNILTDVFAVRRDSSSEWEAMGGIAGFEYEEGYEYRIRISETNYLDYKMGDPAWTEHKLIEVESKERKDTQGLPPNFIPVWYQEPNVGAGN